MNAHNLYAIIAKNMRMLIRAKAGAALILLGPLLLIVIAGIAFDHSDPYTVTVAVHSESYNNITEKFIERLESSHFLVEKVPDSTTCTETIKNARADACIIFPPDFNHNSGQDTIEFTVDYNQVTLVNHILNAFNEQIGQESDTARRQIATNLLNAVETTKREVAQNKPLVVGLATGVESIQKEANQAHTTLSQISIPSAANFTGPDLNSTVTHILKQLLNETSDTLTVSAQDIETISEQTTNATLKSDLQTVADTLDALNTELAQDGTSLITTLDNANNATRALAEQLNTIITQVNTLRITRDSVSAQLGSVEERIQDNLLLTLKLQESLNTLSTSLDTVGNANIDDIARPYRTVINPVTPRQTYLAYLFPSLVMLVVLFGTLIIGPTLVQLERASPAYLRTRLAHAPGTFFTASLLTILVIVLGQVLIVSAVAVLFFGQVSLLALIKSFGIISIATLLFCAIGLIIGYVMPTETGALSAALAVAGGLLLTSNLLLPVQTMPALFQHVLAYNPLTYSEHIIRGILLYNNSVFTYLGNIFILLFVAALLGIIALLIARRRI